MINIKKRLLAIVSLIEENEKIIDVGCDHGLLDVYLTTQKNCFCKACDINNNIIQRARLNFIKYQVLDKIDLFVGNGFNDLNIEEDRTIILAGMGTSTMLKILEKNKTKKIVCQTNTDLYELRKNVCEMGFYISREVITFYNNRFYVTIEFIRGKKIYSYEDYLLGPELKLKQDDLFKKYVNYLYKKNIKGYNKAKEYNNLKNELSKLIEVLGKYKKSIY